MSRSHQNLNDPEETSATFREQETGVQLLARLRPKPSLEGLDNILFPDNIRPGEIVEICGNISSGKTCLVTQLLAKCILPSREHGVSIGGLDLGAIFLNTDHHFRISKLIGIMQDYINSAFQSSGRSRPSDEETSRIIQNSLTKLIAIDCYCSYQFRITVDSLIDTIFSQENTAFIILDSVSAFYWEERDKLKLLMKDLYVENVIKAIRNKIQYFDIPLIYTRQEDFLSKGIKDVFGSKTLVDHKIKLSRSESSGDLRCSIDFKGFRSRSYVYEIEETGFKWLVDSQYTDT